MSDKKIVCPKCGKFALKQIKSKKNGKFWWICQGPQEFCGAIYPDENGSPDVPQENSQASDFIKWLMDEDQRMNALTEWEREFIQSLMEKAEGDFYTGKQIKSLEKIGEKFIDAPEF